MCPVCDNPLSLHGRHELIACLMAAFDFDEERWHPIEDVDGPTYAQVLG